MIHKHRNVVDFKRLLQIIPVHIHVADNHPYVPVTVILLPDKPSDLPRCKDGLLLRISRRMNPYGFLLLFISFLPVPEKIVFQECKYLIFTESPGRPSIQAERLLYPYLCLLCNLHKRGDHPLAECKQLIWMPAGIWVLPLVHNHRHNHLAAAQHKLPQQTVLHRGKSGEAVQYDCTVF